MEEAVNLVKLFNAMSKEEQRAFVELIMQEIYSIQDEQARKLCSEQKETVE